MRTPWPRKAESPAHVPLECGAGSGARLVGAGLEALRDGLQGCYLLLSSQGKLSKHGEMFAKCRGNLTGHTAVWGRPHTTPQQFPWPLILSWGPQPQADHAADTWSSQVPQAGLEFTMLHFGFIIPSVGMTGVRLQLDGFSF